MTSVYRATLVHGKTYTYRDTMFVQGQPSHVTASVRAALMANAFDTITSTQNGEVVGVQRRPKFTFELISGEEPDEDEVEAPGGIAPTEVVSEPGEVVDPEVAATLANTEADEPATPTRRAPKRSRSRRAD